ncbi:RNase adapter RapZ [Nonomuraea sp. NPDC026600]|uniref:RapZ C-terminal domain-containing protein n=1 Tax=Nonomuraea sp. NPDC026600 TaxID=3155363 RepID=UPI0033EF7D62
MTPRTLTSRLISEEEMTMAAVEIVSFGYLHGAPPVAHLTLDLRQHFKDPHVSPELRYMTAHDEPVRATVLNTPGIAALVEATATAVTAFTTGPSAGKVTVADGCAGGRHRAPTFAMALAERLRRDGLTVAIHHRDLDKPVVQR